MGCCASDTEINSLVEKFHCYPDKHFINYIENKLALYSNNNKIDYSKLNEPINIFDDTVLHYAIFHERKELVRYLIEKGANPNKINSRKKTPIDIANNKGNKELLEILEG